MNSDPNITRRKAAINSTVEVPPIKIKMPYIQFIVLYMIIQATTFLKTCLIFFHKVMGIRGV